MRRFRLLLAAAAVVFVGLFGFARPGFAQDEGGSETTEAETTEGITPVSAVEEEHEIGHAEHVCIELLEGGGKIDDCQKAPNPMVPETNELIWGTVGFAVVFGLITWKGLPAIKTGMNNRTERIRSDLDAAEAQRTEATGILADLVIRDGQWVCVQSGEIIPHTDIAAEIRRHRNQEGLFLRLQGDRQGADV